MNIITLIFTYQATCICLYTGSPVSFAEMTEIKLMDTFFGHHTNSCFPGNASLRFELFLEFVDG